MDFVLIQFDQPINKMNNIYKILLIIGSVLIVIAISMMAMRPSVGISDYIQNSQTVEINNANYHSYLNKSIGGNRKKEVFIVENSDNYYALSFYTQMTKGGGKHAGGFLTKDGVIYVVINPIELKRHKGTLNDPYPVLNYGHSKETYVWDEKQYQTNVQMYLGFDFNLSDETYYFGWILIIGIFLIGTVIIVHILLIKEEQ
ncbi:Uncharacterised protein [Moraxella lacunata]|uniref:Uncharacterized protein n=1 Tax=Moraxella lacunata TaxID=477 RepID=A0A378TSW8_MORLA|nr:hypothetical protein [Moraxella lacunata]STZ62813.1 Uncharacterised protein [Moraxella lacunata]